MPEIEAVPPTAARKSERFRRLRRRQDSAVSRFTARPHLREAVRRATLSEQELCFALTTKPLTHVRASLETDVTLETANGCISTPTFRWHAY
jgi:hypothetical protein